jgi:hypothetical protein
MVDSCDQLNHFRAAEVEMVLDCQRDGSFGAEKRHEQRQMLCPRQCTRATTTGADPHHVGAYGVSKVDVAFQVVEFAWRSSRLESLWVTPRPRTI